MDLNDKVARELDVGEISVWLSQQKVYFQIDEARTKLSNRFSIIIFNKFLNFNYG